MKVSTALGCVVVLCAALFGNATNAATVQFSDTLDLSNLQYPVTINGTNGNAAADILRFDLGSGWSGAMDMQLTTDPYNIFTTALGLALTTDPNDTLFNNPSTFLLLSNTYATNTTAFFNDHVIGWEFYLWGSNYIASNGTTTDVTGYFSSFQFDPTAHYYAFIAGGSVISDYVDVDLAVSSVPVPAAVWLFGSGIVGLVGMARRKAQQSV